MTKGKLVLELRRKITAALAPLVFQRDLYQLAIETLSRTSRGLSSGQSPGWSWSLLPVFSARAISSESGPATEAAAAFQLLMAAGDIFDDVEDGDITEGIGVAINCASALIFLAESAFCNLKAWGIPDRTICQILELVNSKYTEACIGQHEDLSLSLSQVNEEDYLATAERKSASQIGCACEVGAVVGGASHGLAEAFFQFGSNLGMAAQLTNDIQGITFGKDIESKKITFPVVTYLGMNGHPKSSEIHTWYSGGKTDLNTKDISNLLFQSGSIHYATTMVEQYKQRAKCSLAEMEFSGADVESLVPFLS
jgi:geranylgeranyl pyrophosphate synthase